MVSVQHERPRLKGDSLLSGGACGSCLGCVSTFLPVGTTFSLTERRPSPLVPASGPRSGRAAVIPTPPWPVSTFVSDPGWSGTDAAARRLPPSGTPRTGPCARPCVPQMLVGVAGEAWSGRGGASPASSARFRIGTRRWTPTVILRCCCGHPPAHPSLAGNIASSASIWATRFFTAFVWRWNLTHEWSVPL